MMKRIFSLVVIAFFCVSAYCADNKKDVNLNSMVVRVDSTSLANLNSAFDVLMQMNGISYTDKEILVDKKIKADVYIGDRRLYGITDLYHLPANHISTIKIDRSPNASYGKQVRAVIIITLLKDFAEGIRLDNHFQMDMTHKLATGNELNIGLKRRQFDVGAFLAINETYSKPYEEDDTWTYNYYGENKAVLKSLSTSNYSAESYTQLLTGAISLGYDFSINHNLKVSYNCKWLRVNNSFYDDRLNSSYNADEFGHIDRTNPTSQSTQDGRTRHPKTHHTFDIEYNGKVGDWSIKAGNTSFKEFANKHAQTFYDTDISYSNFLRKEANSRTYFNLKRDLWNGSITFGPEYVYSGMDVLSEDFTNDTPSDDRIHAFEKEHSFAAFVNTTQTFGNLTLDVGVRYETVKYNYKSLPDDQGVRPIDFNRHYNRVYPNVTATMKFGENTLTLSHIQTFNKPYLGDTRIEIMGSFEVDHYMIKTERIMTNSIGWQWKALSLRAEHNYFKDPVCNGYTGKSYHAMDFYADVKTNVSIWQPSLSVNLHKQWFYQLITDSKNSLKTPICFVQLNNLFTLPCGWNVRLNGKWRSSGAVRDKKYLRGNFAIDMAIQKAFLKNKLIAELSATNLIHSPWNYNVSFSELRDRTMSGTQSRMVRMVSLSLRYTL